MNREYGKLKLLKKVIVLRNGCKRICWECLCACGKIKIIRQDVILSSNANSCGECPASYDLKIENENVYLKIKNDILIIDFYTYLLIKGKAIHISKIGKKKYAYVHDINKKRKNRRNLRFHRYITSAPTAFLVDHINGDTLDNRLENLRYATASENSRNQKISSRNTSGYKGVTWIKKMNKWKSSISVNLKRINIGYFDNKHLAAVAYNKASIKYHGNFAKLNIIKEDKE